MLERLTAYLSTQIPNATLVWLRIAMGLLGGGDILGNGIYYHWHKRAFDSFTFRYYGFEWVQPLPEPFFSAFFIVGFLLGVAVALGWRFRITAPLFALAFSYLFLLEKAHYLNHAYFFCWLAWLLALTPAWREWSLDVRRNPASWSPTAPRWSVILFPGLMGVVYFFGGIAKINADWLLDAMPLHLWIRARAETPIIGPLLVLKPTAYFMAWGGFLLDFTITFLLLHRRLRWWALAAAIFFHATNHLIFNIGIFPYLSLFLTSLFFEPDWPRRLLEWLSEKLRFVAAWRASWQERVRLGTITGSSAHLKDSQPITAHSPFHIPTTLGSTAAQPKLLWGLGILLGVHLFLPLRHHAINSEVAWSEEGHRYSWRMMLRSKTGYGTFKLVNKLDGTTVQIQPRDSLNSKQARKLFTHPDMILQYAHHLGDNYRAAGWDPAVYVNIQAKLNHGKYHRYIDPNVDLMEIEWTWLRAKNWVLSEEE